jgi:hypothetical protein
MFKKNTMKCGKKPGESCRLHSPQEHSTLKAKEQFIRDGLREYRKREMANKKHPCKPEAEMLAQVDAEKKNELALQEKRRQNFLVNDMEEHMNLVVDPVTGKKTVSVFRSGIVAPPKERGVEKDSYLYCDEHVPEGRQGRNTGIFASPTVNGVAHWVRGVSSVVADCGVRELRVDPDEVHVYSVHAWEEFSGGWYGFTPESAKKYWDTGMTLTQWHEQMRTNPNFKPEQWELLLNSETIKASNDFDPDIVARKAFFSSEGERDTHTYRLLTDI